MYFGLGSFVEKFEEYFGRLATRIMLGLVGAAVAAVCVQTVLSSAIMPLIAYFDALKRYGFVLAATPILLTVAGVVAGGVVGASITTARWKRADRRAQREIDRLAEVLNSALKEREDAAGG